MRYIISLLLILISVQAHAFSAAIQAVLGASTASPYIFQENFNATGYDNDWTSNGTVIDPDWTTSPAPLEGAQSLAINPSDDYPYTYSEDFTAQSVPVYGYMMLNIAVIDTVLGGYPIGYAKAGGGDLGYIVADSGKWKCFVPGGTPQTGTTTIVGDGTTTYHMWSKQTVSSGSNGEFTLWLSTSTTKPETAECTATGGTTTGNIGRFIINGSSGVENNFYIIDKIRLSTTEIGSNPQ